MAIDPEATDPPAPIAITSGLLAELYAHARAAFPDECCGYLAGPRDDATCVDAVVRCHNAQADLAQRLDPDRGADRGFVIAGRELFELAKTFDGARPARVVYHSHPNGRAYFSGTDHALATSGGRPVYPVQHVVVGISATAVVEVAQFAWSEAARAYVEVARLTVGAPA